MGENAASPFWLEEYSEKQVTPFSLKRKVKSKKHDFVGWGSKPLIQFLESIGKDTTKEISQHDVADIIVKYVNENSLVNPAKKKRIICDERLFSIFGRKTIGRNKVYDLLETHYAENQDIWDEDFVCSSEEDNLGEDQRSVVSHKETYKKIKVSETPKSGLAKIVAENIKLVYLKRSLVQELLKHFESFEAKVVGSFVRIKLDPNFYLHKNSHQLVLVKGLKKAFGSNDVNTDILLDVSNYVRAVSISILSDDDFSEEELEDLCQRMINGSLKRPTVVELEAKAHSLHADITNHWIATQVTLLGKQMERANEKGWRGQFNECMKRREELQTEEEKSRLLLTLPNVVADEIEPETPPQGSLDDKNKNDSSPTSTIKEAFKVPSDTAANGKLSTLMPSTTDSAVQPSAISKANTDTFQIHSSFTGSKDNLDKSYDVHEQLKQPSDSNDQSAQLVNAPQKDGHIEKQSSVNIPSIQVIDLSAQLVNAPEKDGDIEKQSSVNVRSIQVIDLSAQLVNAPEKDGHIEKQSSVNTPSIQVIDLSDDEEHEDSNEVQAEDEVMWHYTDPQGNIQGPFSLKSLKGWSDGEYFPPDFKVWKTGQSKAEAELLTDLLREMFPL